MDLGGVTGNLTRLHFAVMGMLSRHNLTISEVADRIFIPRPQMTRLIDKLEDMDIVVRNPDTEDRRVIVLSLTPRGRQLLEDMRLKVQENIRKRLAVLTSEELEDMAGAMETLRRLVEKVSSFQT